MNIRYGENCYLNYLTKIRSLASGEKIHKSILVSYCQIFQCNF